MRCEVLPEALTSPGMSVNHLDLGSAHRVMGNDKQD
jgi:hypothetical protein